MSSKPTYEELEQRVRKLEEEAREATQAEQAQRESEEKYRQVFATESDAIVVFYADTFEFIDVNDAALKLYGWTRNEFLKLKITDVSAEPEATRISVERTIAGSISNIPFRYHKKKDETIFAVEISSSTFMLGNRKMVCGAIRDISERMRSEEELREHRDHLERLVEQRTVELEATNKGLRREVIERKEAERRLRESETRLRTAVESLPFDFFLIEPDGRYAMQNAMCGQHWGDVVGKRPEDIAPDKETLALWQTNNRRAFAGEVVEEEVCVYRRGEEAHLLNIISPIRDGDQTRGILGVNVDITKSKQAETKARENEERFRALFEGALDAIFIADPESGMILDANPVASELLLRPHEKIVGSHYTQLHPSHLELLERKNFTAVSQDKSMNRPIESKVLRSDGSEIPVEILAHRIQVHGVPVVYGTFRDISERKRIAEELSKIQRIESLGILAGGIAHDLNNILTPILVNISMVKAFGALQGDISQMLSDAEHASLRAKQLTQRLLTFAKGGKPVKETVSISKLLRDTVEFALSGSKARCEFLIPESLWLAEVDEVQISQVIQNVIINANQAMPRGGTIRICAENVIIGKADPAPLKKGRHLKISITDEGTGIGKKDLQHIFDPFFTTKQKGSGLGLTTAFSIVNNHDGHICADSELRVGTTFHVYLPASHRTSTEKEREEGRPIKGEGKVLVIDDEETIRKSASEVLKRLGYQVGVAKDHEEGVELYEEASKAKHPFDVVIMDLTIRGGMGAKEAIRKLLNVDRNLRAIASSGYSGDPVMSKFKDYGFSGVLAKPYRIEELAAAIHQVLKETDE